ncbi:signal peptidase II [soil metagenome]
MSGTAPSPTRRRALPGRLVYVVWADVAAIWFVLDQATKVLAVDLLTGRGVIDAGLGGALEWELVRNTNAAFGIPGFSGMFVIVSVLVLALVVRALPRTDRLSLAFAYGLVSGGALGNLMDRLFREPGFPNGGVIDFVKVGWWPKFNLADSAIVVGALLIAVLMFVVEREEAAASQARERSRSVRPGTTGPRG